MCRIDVRVGMPNLAELRAAVLRFLPKNLRGGGEADNSSPVDALVNMGSLNNPSFGCMKSGIIIRWPGNV